MHRWLCWSVLAICGCRGAGYCDRDRDGYAGPRGDCLASELVPKVDGFGDCDDADREVHPEHDEICENRIDDDCDGQIDETGEPDEPHIPPHYQDRDGDGFGDPLTERWCVGEGIPAGGDCDDEDPDVYPGGDELLDNGIDDDCDGIVDLHDPITIPDILLACNAYDSTVDVLDELVLIAEGIDPYGQTLRYDWYRVDVPQYTTQSSDCSYFSYTYEEFLGEGQEISETIYCSGEYTFQVIATSEDGRTSEPCLVTVEVVPTLDVELFWTRDEDDLDLHLIAPGGSIEHETLDCYYRNCVSSGPDWGIPGDPSDDPALELDDTMSTGPERIRLPYPADGTYRVVVHDYPTTAPGGDLQNTAYIDIYIDSILVWTDEFDVIGEDQYYEIAEISFPEQSVTALP